VRMALNRSMLFCVRLGLAAVAAVVLRFALLVGASDASSSGCVGGSSLVPRVRRLSSVEETVVESTMGQTKPVREVKSGRWARRTSNEDWRE
jgi:hypothetical protein